MKILLALSVGIYAGYLFFYSDNESSRTIENIQLEFSDPHADDTVNPNCLISNYSWEQYSNLPESAITFDCVDNKYTWGV